MLLGVELEPVDQISKSVLYSIINLYVRVRSFSLAKDIITCHKIDIKKSKDKGAVTLGNFSCNLSRNFVATQVERCDTGCLNRVTLGNVSMLFWKLS